jgi:hypothetical protein
MWHAVCNRRRRIVYLWILTAKKGAYYVYYCQAIDSQN